MTSPQGARGPRDVLADYLDQRARLGDPPMFLTDAPRSQFLDRVDAAARAALRRSGPDPAEASGPAGRQDTAAARTGSDAQIDPSAFRVARAPASYDDLREQALGCTACRLSEGRTKVVFSDGTPTARLMVVGEAPGANEDATGLPFVGQAGKLLDLILASADLSRRDSVYICNVLKCRPPGNRNPMPDEIEACSQYLAGQIDLVSPEVILAVGTFAAQWLTGTQKALGKLRGEVYSYRGVPLVVTYHPAAPASKPLDGPGLPGRTSSSFVRSWTATNRHRTGPDLERTHPHSCGRTASRAVRSAAACIHGGGGLGPGRHAH